MASPIFIDLRIIQNMDMNYTHCSSGHGALIFETHPHPLLKQEVVTKNEWPLSDEVFTFMRLAEVNQMTKRSVQKNSGKRNQCNLAEW